MATCINAPCKLYTRAQQPQLEVDSSRTITFRSRNPKNQRPESFMQADPHDGWDIVFYQELTRPPDPLFSWDISKANPKIFHSVLPGGAEGSCFLYLCLQDWPLILSPLTAYVRGRCARCFFTSRELNRFSQSRFMPGPRDVLNLRERSMNSSANTPDSSSRVTSMLRFQNLTPRVPQ